MIDPLDANHRGADHSITKVCHHDLSFNALVSAVIAQDGTYRVLLVEEEEKRKRVV
jgi:hypothetical protein